MPQVDPPGVKYRTMVAHWHRQHEVLAKGAPVVDVQYPPPSTRDHERVRQLMVDRFGDRYTRYRQDLHKAMRQELIPPGPIHLDIDVKDACNLACINCTENFRPWNQADLDIDVLKADPYFKTGHLSAVNIGDSAEAFINVDSALDLVDFFATHGVMDTFIHTNGLNLTTEIVDALIDAKASWLSISIDALTAETYRQVRGKGFDQLMANIEMVLARRRERNAIWPMIRIGYFQQIENLQEMYGFWEKWRSKVEWVEFSGFTSTTPIGDRTRPPVADHPLFEPIAPTHCTQPFWRMYVDARGEVGPCCKTYAQSPDLILGKIGEDTIQEMWNSPKANRIRGVHLERDAGAGLAVCHQCLDSLYQLRYYSRPEANGWVSNE